MKIIGNFSTCAHCMCSDTCDFWYYRSGCAVASITLLFDNGGTVFFALFMALWGMWQNTL